MNAPVPRFATGADHPLLDGYARFCNQVGLGDHAVRDRLLQARGFLAAHPDLRAWVERPLRTRLADLKHHRSWPLLVWALLEGRISLDLDLLAVKTLSGISLTASRLWPHDIASVSQVGTRLGWSRTWTNDVIDATCLLIAFSHHRLHQLTKQDVEDFVDAVAACSSASAHTRRHWCTRTFGVCQVLYELQVITAPPRRRWQPGSLARRFEPVAAPEIRRAMLRYVNTRSAVLSRSSVGGLVDALIPFGEFLANHHPEIKSLRQLQRCHIEQWLVWNRTRTWRGRVARDQQISASAAHGSVLAVRNMFDDLTLWGWAERPKRRLIFSSDVPRLPRPLPRGLAPDVDAALVAEAAGLEDDFARVGIHVLRRTGLRLGELLDLSLDCLVDYGPTGTWLRVPLGKLGTERSVPVDADTVAAINSWIAIRGSQRPHPSPHTGKPCDYLFTRRGKRLTGWGIRKGLEVAVAAAGLTGPGGDPLRVTPHQLRHTYATELVNAGMSLQAVMALLGHVTPEMTLRYAALSSPTLRASYDEAMGKVRKVLPVISVGRPPVPARVEWLASEYLKTRVATGYCSRHLSAQACPYANVCETCENFVPGQEFVPALRAQLDDVRQLKADAEVRNWSSEQARHGRVIQALEQHLNRLENRSGTGATT